MDVDLNRLRSLLAQGVETPELDYKATWSVDERHDLVELAKDVAAIEALPSGGYILIGANDDGAPSGLFNEPAPGAFDEQKVRSRLISVLGEPLDLTVGLHVLNDHWFLLLGVGAHVSGFRIMDRDGQYQDRLDKQKTLWRAGDVFVRRGTSSERWNYHEARDLVERVIEQRKEQWRADVFATIRGQSPIFESGGYVNVSVDIPLEALEQSVLQLIRREDRVGLDVLLRRVRASALRAVEGAHRSETAVVQLSDQLLRLGVIAVLSARYDMRSILSSSLSSFQAIYNAIDRLQVRFIEGSDAVLLYLYGVGGALVLDEKWGEIRALVQLVPEKSDLSYWKTILRKAEVMSARARLGDSQETGQRLGLIERAKGMAVQLFDLTGLPSDDETATSSLVQFDVYRGIVVNKRGQSNSYVNFAFYWTDKAEPAFVNVVTNPGVRHALTDLDDSDLRAVIREMDQLAHNEAFMYNAWFGLQDRRLVQFLEQS
ncbi:helix-turn-helix domain-containing protein [Amnibacterium endophyticum]|uniref:Helix-turn-helix domain-containing protein n=1 Tax=Amnibacterium endophyticum TaxID=2109337 RepID=A0ABW4LGC7_9MICO